MQDQNNYELIAMTASTLIGSLMATVIEQVKVLPKSWQQLSERDQAEYIERVEKQVVAAVQQAMRVLVAQDSVVIAATVDKVTFKDGVQAVLDLSKHAHGVLDLAQAAGQEVHIMISDGTVLESREGRPKPQKDQPDLPLGDPPSDGGGDSNSGGGGAAVAIEDRSVKTLADMPRDELEALVKAAVDHIVEYQVASLSFLQSKLNISSAVAGELLAVLADRGYVSKPNHEGLRTVLVSDGAAPAKDPEPAHRVCKCDIKHDELEGSKLAGVIGLQDCPGHEPDAGGRVCTHCAHDDPCHHVEAPQAAPEPAAEEVRDELFEEAKAHVIKTDTASVSNLQRFLKVGYNRAAAIMEQLERAGIVSEKDVTGTRNVLPQEGEA